MKPINSPTLLFLSICGLLIASANQSHAREHHSSYQTGAIFASSLADGGCLMIKHSPTLGINVGIVITIDRHLAGAFSKGHLYVRYLTPGPHTITVSRNGREWDAWHMTLNVRRGQTYAYVVKYSVNQLLLIPVSGFH